MIFKFKMLATLWMACVSMALSQPIGCTESSQCSSGFYCEESAHYCRECLRCADLKREAPAPPAACVTSVLQCGDCFKGFVMDLSLDQRACVVPTAKPEDSVPVYIWVFVGLAVLLAVFLIFSFIILKKENIMQFLKIRATTSIRSTSGAGAAPSAPELRPPAYEDVCASPDPPYNHAFEQDASQPFIKPEAPGWAGAAGGARVPAARQEAQPFNNPAYIRGPPSTYNPSEESEPGSPFPPHDEETMESLWTPNEPSNNNTISNTNGFQAGSGEAAAGPLAPAARTRRASSDAGPPPKTLCIRQDSNSSADTNVGTETTGAGAAGAGDDAPGAVTLVINNVFNNVNVKMQRH